MFAGSLILALTLLGFAAWLHYNERLGWPNESYDSDTDHEYLTRRMRARRRIHVILAVCGLLILIASFAGPSHVLWVAAWMSVMAALMTVVILAALDAYRTQRYHAKKLPEIRSRMLGGDD